MKEVFFISGIMGPSQIEHLSAEAARQEAKKHAQANPGTRFTVFRSIVDFVAGDVQTTEHADYTEDSDFAHSKY